MKFIKRLTALLLSAACVCALVCVPPAGAASAVSTFPDVTDPQVGRAVEALRTMGVISGSGGRFNPGGSLTRAEFCKMAILVMGKGDEANAQANRTIFTDVPGKHWARGYVNLASLTPVGGEDGKGGSRLMMGLGNGSFAPDRAITYGEAVTAVLRILGYAKEANFNWPYGAVASATAIGLDSGFTPPKAGDPITRAQAAMLFCNMLTAPISGEKERTFLASLGYDVHKGALLLSSDITENGRAGYVKVFTGDNDTDMPKLPAVNTPASFLEGTRGTVVFDKPGKDGKFLTFVPDTGSTSKVITVAKINGRVLTATDGSTYTLSSTTPVWINGKEDSFTNVLSTLSQGNTSVTVCFASSGAVESLFVHGTSMSLTGGVMVAREKVSGNPFAQLTAGTVDYKIVKNGAEVTTSALKQYDVAAFDPSNKTLYVTDFRLTGVYESAEPNTSMPTKIKLSLIGEDLEVLDSAVDDLKNLKLNSTVTLLFSPDGKVAGAVSSSTLRSNTVGYVDKEQKNIRLLNAPQTGDDGPNLSTLKAPENVERYADCLVTVSGTRSGTTNSISLSRLSGKASSGSLDLKNRTLGGVALAENVIVFDRIANSGIQPTTLAAVAMDSVPASKIAYQRTNAAGKIDLLVLDDVTGDLYTYGRAEITQDTSHEKDPMPYTNTLTTVTNSNGKDGNNTFLPVVGGTTYKEGQFIGLAASVEKLSNTNFNRHAASVLLKSVEKVSPANFNLSTGLFFSGSIELPIWEGILGEDGKYVGGVQCYNAQTKSWFDSGDTPMDNLNACLAYSSNLTVYYDRDPAQGGKVRVVVAN